jgi:1-acyl-sn-glycerol-3-phosphate acyltransferase
MFREWLSFLWRDILWWWIKIVFGPPLRLFFRTQARGKKPFPAHGKAAFLLANHTNTVDPFMIADFINRPIRYVVTDEYYRYKVSRTLLRWAKGIPKTKSIPDSVTMRMLLKGVKQGGIIGVFPEGRRNWDGETLPLDDTIPRLVKKLRLPVICVRQRGSYLSWPRWSNWPRRGRVIFDFSYLFENPEEIPQDEAKIKRRIEEKLSYSELEDPEITKHIFASPRIAEHLELRLWLCPHCLRFFTLKSEKEHLFCTSCGASWRFIGNGTFQLERQGEPCTDSRNFKYYIDWARWNDAQTLPILLDRKKQGRDPLVSTPAKMWSVPTETGRDRDFQLQDDGMAALSPDFRMVFVRNQDRKPLFDAPIAELKGPGVTWNHKFEFFLPGMAYRFTFYGQSAYFWHLLAMKLKHLWRKLI